MKVFNDIFIFFRVEGLHRDKRFPKRLMDDSSV